MIGWWFLYNIDITSAFADIQMVKSEFIDIRMEFAENIAAEIYLDTLAKI